jgi:tetratricopeptide (TPR) repeat protein
MKNIRIYVGILILAAFCLGAWAQQTADEKLFQEAKLLIFDEKWEPAQAKLEEFLAKYPYSPFSSQALYYKSKCQEERGQDKEALKGYEQYLQLIDINKNLAEDAEGSVIEIAFKFYGKGDKAYLKKIEERLESSSKSVRYYAAYKLSFVKEKEIARKGVPILQKIVQEERDPDLLDRAKIALLRVSPEALSGVEPRTEMRARMLKILIYDERSKNTQVSLSFPMALADLVLAAISDNDRQAIRARGYDLDKIVKELQSAKGNIIEIHDAKEGKLIKIWIE